MRRLVRSDRQPYRMRNALLPAALGLLAAGLPSAVLSAAAASTGFTVSRRAPVGLSPTFVAVDPATDTIYAISRQAGEISVIDGVDRYSDIHRRRRGLPERCCRPPCHL